MTLKLALCWHIHQPTYQLNKWFDKAFNCCYWSILESFENHPHLKGNLHISGGVLQKLPERYPNFLERLKNLVKKGRIELLTSTFHQSILPMWSGDDNIFQIKKHKNKINELFGKKPSGMWIPERVWSPEQISVVKKAGVKYVLLDEDLMFRANPNAWEVDKYTPGKKKGLVFFNIDKRMRYLVPFKNMDETFGYLNYVNKLNINDDLIVNCADDAEKVGLWNNYGYAQNWLKKFYDSLENSPWIETIHYSDYLKWFDVWRERDYGKGTYEEMEAWSGGDFFNHLNHPVIKPLYSRIQTCKPHIKTDLGYENYLTSQCNDVFWSMNSITYFRQMAYYHAIKSCSIPNGFDSTTNCYVLNNKNSTLWISPDKGGRIIEWDYKKTGHNLCNSFLSNWPYLRNSFSIYLSNYLSEGFPGELNTVSYEWEKLRNGIRMYYITKNPKYEKVLVIKEIKTRKNSEFFDASVELINIGKSDRYLKLGVEFFYTLPTFSTETMIMDFHKNELSYMGDKIVSGIEDFHDGPGVHLCTFRDDFHNFSVGCGWEPRSTKKHIREIVSQGYSSQQVYPEVKLGKDEKVKFSMFFGISDSFEDFNKKSLKKWSNNVFF